MKKTISMKFNIKNKFASFVQFISLILLILLQHKEMNLISAIDSETIQKSSISNVNNNNNNNRQLGLPAPYAIENVPTGSSAIATSATTTTNQTVKNLIFRLLAYNNNQNQSFKLGDNFENNNNKNKSDTDNNNANKSWSFIGQNGTPLVGSKINLDLNKLVKALSNQNITSEITFNNDNNDEKNGGLLNITISKNNSPHETNKIDEYFLEDLMIESRNPMQINSTSIIKDNHRSSNQIDLKYQSRSKLMGSGIIFDRNNNSLNNSLFMSSNNNSNNNNNNHDLLLLTPPPIRNSIEIVAENYTCRKITDEANIFAIKLLNQLNIEKLGSQNLIQAPFSVYQGLTLLLSGSQGETSKELNKVLLGSQSSYENNRLTHDQDLVRLLASLNDVIKQLQLSSSHHFKAPNDTDRILINGPPYFGGSQEQHLIVANNLLFSSSAYEISNEFKNILNLNYNNTALTKMEVGSTESIQLVNSWIRKTTNGLIPTILNRKTTFDEFNVMSLLSTSWLMQEWKDTFYRVSSPIRSNIRLKGQGKALKINKENKKLYPINDNVDDDESFLLNERKVFNLNNNDYNNNNNNNQIIRTSNDNIPLLEFVDDDKQSHFVEYLKSKPTKSIQHYHGILNGIMVDIVVIPFKDSNHRMITLTPLILNNINNLNLDNQINNINNIYSTKDEFSPDSSSLTKLISVLANNPRKAIRSLWAIVAPDIITKQTYQNIQLAKHLNITIDDRIVETTITPMVQLSMPMIRTDADSSLTASLNHIGIVNAFDHDQANFIGINGHPFNYYKLHLSNVVSKTTFNLDERGINYDRTIKSLASMRIFPERKNYDYKSVDEQETKSNDSSKKGTITIDNKDYNLEFVDEVKLNKPYVYLISDFRTKLILYTGIMRNPQQQSQTIPQ